MIDSFTHSFIHSFISRAGIGLLLKGIDESVVNMHVGDKYHLVFGGDLAFGQKGRSSGDELMVMMMMTMVMMMMMNG